MGIKNIRFVYGLPLTSSPAAFHTIRTHLSDTGTSPGDFDLIVTGDLGSIGVEALMQLCRETGVCITEVRTMKELGRACAIAVGTAAAATVAK